MSQLETMLSELEAKAKAATLHANDELRAVTLCESNVAANPSTIERLIAIIRRLEAAVKAEHYCGDPGVDCDACNALADVERIAGGDK